MPHKKSPIADLPASVSCRKVQNSAGVTYWRVRVGKKFTGGSVLEKNFASLGKAKEWIFGDIQRLKAQPGSLIGLKASAGAAAFSLTPAQITEAVDAYRRLAETPLGLTEAVDFAIRHACPTAGTLSIYDAIEAAKRSKKSNRKAYFDDLTRRWRRFAKWLPAEKRKAINMVTVTAIDGESITFGDGRVVKRFGPLHLDQGIAVTSHASQGKTVDQVIVSVPVAAFSQTNEAQFYVSMSRARHAMHLYTDSKVALKEAVMRPNERLSPLELLEGIKSEQPLVAEIQYARAAAKSDKPRENRSFVYTQQDRSKATEREPER